MRLKGDLDRHRGEEFSYVPGGTIVVHNSNYPFTSAAGQAIGDWDSGDAYTAFYECDEAEWLALMSGAKEVQMQSLLTLDEHRHSVAAVPTGAGCTR